jgi:predicted DNA-binding transcriptional regulator AlpA
MYQLPETGYLRLPQIIGNPKAGIPALLPISRSSFWAGVKTGRFPRPVKLGPRTTAWRVEDIRALIQFNQPGAAPMTAETWPSSAPVPLCSACESGLRQVHGKWVCAQSGCPLYGREQLVMPDAPSRDKTQRMNTR